MAGQVGILAAIVIYLAAMVYVGFYFSKKGSGDSTDEFYLGGRKLGPLVTAMSAEASDMSSWLLMGLPGVAYLTGISDAGWTAIGLNETAAEDLPEEKIEIPKAEELTTTLGDLFKNIKL